MSREDPQLRIRLPTDLKEKIEKSAKQNSRSMNSEIVNRIESTFFNHASPDVLLTAKQVVDIAKSAQKELSDIIFRRTFSQIERMAKLGHSTIEVGLSDLQLEGLDDNDYLRVFALTFSKLKELGYIVPDEAWDANGFIVIANIEEF
ncbi:Arc family DNA-binding protein [Rosenbergiella nectarea]|uniref:Arc family DNA-binding protein n=1 Tax=Rosenbergiella nectarea TaxID=988801 RepID=UPI001F4EDD19|nr:Arc family DNA-binding protein [Rosenbergiella nectarea]